MTFEDKIIAYLEGSLDEESSAELLHTLSVNPEKRMVLEEHLRLKDILVLGQRPLLVPQQAERSLANILPILAEPGEIGMAPAVARWTTVASGGAGILTRIRMALTMRPVVTAFSAAALLASSSALWYSHAFGPEDSTVNQPVASQDVSHIASGTGNSANNFVSEAPTAVQSNNASGADQGNSHVNHFSSADVRSSGHGHNASRLNAASIEDLRDARNHSNSASSHRNVIGSGPQSIGSNPTLRADRLGSEEEASHNHNATVNPVAASITSDSIGEIPVVASRTSRIDPEGKQDHTLTEIATPLGQDPTGRVSLGVSLSTYQFPSSSIGGTKQSSLLPEISISYEVSEHFAIGASGGMTAVSSNNTAPSEESVNKVNLSGYSQVVYTTTTEILNASWAGLNVRYTINPFDPYAIHMELLGGAAYHTVFTPTLSLGAGFTHMLADRVQFDAGVIATGSWGRESLQSAYQGSASAVGIRHEDVVVTNQFTPSLGMRVAIRYSL